MGNCQAIDAASLVIQHPNGRVERLYWPVPANEVMKSNKGHYVALIITTSCLSEGGKSVENVRVTRVKILKPADILVLGHAYRLIDSQEVMKGLWAKKYAKMQKKELGGTEKPPLPPRVREIESPVFQKEANPADLEVNQAAVTQEKQRRRVTPSASARIKNWRPSLHSISEAGIAQQSQKTVQPGIRKDWKLEREELPRSSR